MSEYFQRLFEILKSNGFKEPRKGDFPTYQEAYKRWGNNARSPYFEDIHYVWRLIEINK